MENNTMKTISKQPFNLTIETFEQKNNYPFIIGGLIAVVGMLTTILFLIKKKKK